MAEQRVVESVARLVAKKADKMVVMSVDLKGIQKVGHLAMLRAAQWVHY